MSFSYLSVNNIVCFHMYSVACLHIPVSSHNPIIYLSFYVCTICMPWFVSMMTNDLKINSRCSQCDNVEALDAR